MFKLIRNWEELSKIEKESKTHILEVDLNGYCGWLHCKTKEDYNPKEKYESQIPKLDHYLSTHSFYGRNYKHSSKILQLCGFDVEIESWD